MASKYGYHGFGATSWAWHTIDLRQPSSNGRLVLLGLARYYDDKKGYCYPTIEELQKATGLGNTSVKAARKELRDAGIIAWKHRSNPGGYSNCVYTFPQYLPDTKADARQLPAPDTVSTPAAMSFTGERPAAAPIPPPGYHGGVNFATGLPA